MNCLDFGGLRGLPGGGDARTWGNRHEAGCGAAVCRGDMLATRLHRSPLALAADSASADPEAVWVEVPEARSVACDLVVDGTRLVVASAVRQRRDDTRRAQLIARTEAQLLAPEEPRAGRTPTGPSQDRLGRHPHPLRLGHRPGLRGGDRPGTVPLPLQRGGLDYEEAMAGRYLLTTSLPQEEASTQWVVGPHRSLTQVEDRFRMLNDFLHLRPSATGPRPRSEATSRSASTPRCSKPSSAETSGPPTCETPTSPTNTSQPPGRCESATASAGSTPSQRRHHPRPHPPPPPPSQHPHRPRSRHRPLG